MFYAKTLKSNLFFFAVWLVVAFPIGSANAAGESAPAPPPAQRVSRHAAGWQIGTFVLRDQQGRTFDQDRLRGRWTFLLIGDTECGEPCSSALAALAGMLRRIASTEAVKTTQVVFVLLDPERDTADHLQRYVAAFDGGFIAATGTQPALAQLVDDIGGAPASDHRGSIVLVGPDGAIRAEYLPPFDMKRLTAEFLKMRARG